MGVTGDRNTADEGDDDGYTLDEAMDLAGHGRYNYLALAACSVISNGVALDMFGFSVVLAAARCDLELGLVETGALASAPFAGVAAALPWGYYADTCGRRRALLLSSITGFLLAAISSFSVNWQMMIVLKVFGCAFSTASFTLTMTYLGECTNTKKRDAYIFIVTAVNLSSEFVSFALAYLLLPLEFSIPLSWLSITYRPWRLFSFIMASILGIGALMMFFLEESPKFLADQGKTTQALEVLRKMYEANGGVSGEYPVTRIRTARTGRKDETFCTSVVNQTVPLFQPPLLWRTLQLFYLITVACSTNNVFLMWYATMVNVFFNSLSHAADDGSFCERVVGNLTVRVGTNVDTMLCNDRISPYTLYSGMFYGIFYTVLTLGVSRIASRRRLILMAVFAVAAISGILLNLISHPLVTMLLFILLQATVLGIGSVASYFVDMYPTIYRGMSMSLGMMVARLMSFTGVNVVGSVIVDHCHSTFYSWSAFIFSGVIVAFLLPADQRLK